jgi:hypothetical protein
MTADDPLILFRRYVLSRDTKFLFHPELWLRQNGTIPTRSCFMGRLSLPDKDFGSHSLRAGGATDLASNGVPHYLIQSIGRWSSDSFPTIHNKPIPFLVFRISAL